MANKSSTKDLETQCTENQNLTERGTTTPIFTEDEGNNGEFIKMNGRRKESFTILKEPRLSN